MHNNAANRQTSQQFTLLYIMVSFRLSFRNHQFVLMFVVNPFFRKSVSVMQFMSQKTFNMTVPADDATQNFWGFCQSSVAHLIFSCK